MRLQLLYWRVHTSISTSHLLCFQDTLDCPVVRHSARPCRNCATLSVLYRRTPAILLPFKTYQWFAILLVLTASVLSLYIQPEHRPRSHMVSLELTGTSLCRFISNQILYRTAVHMNCYMWSDRKADEIQSGVMRDENAICGQI